MAEKIVKETEIPKHKIKHLITNSTQQSIKK